jgi:predicted DNA binding CopG/RHH family protein
MNSTACAVLLTRSALMLLGATEAGRVLIAVWTPRQGSGCDCVRREPRLSATVLEQPRMKPKRVIPAFESEAKDAEWWRKNRATLDRDLAEAAKKGQLKRLNQAMPKARLAASKARVVSIRLPENDIELARRQAGEKGLPYQTYIKSLLHQALRQSR